MSRAERLNEALGLLAFYEGEARPEFPGAQPTVRINGQDFQTILDAVRAALAPESGGREPSLVTCGMYRHGAGDGLVHVLRADCHNPKPWKRRPTTEDEWWEAGHCPMYPGDGPRCETLEQTSECEDDCNCTSRLVTDLGLPSTSQVTMPGPQPAVVSGSEITGVAAPGARHGQEPSSPSSAQGEAVCRCQEAGYGVVICDICGHPTQPSRAGGGS